jgi:hypothetical protein
MMPARGVFLELLRHKEEDEVAMQWDDLAKRIIELDDESVPGGIVVGRLKGHKYVFVDGCGNIGFYDKAEFFGLSTGYDFALAVKNYNANNIVPWTPCEDESLITG